MVNPNVNNVPPAPSMPKKKFVAKGHDAQLQEAQFNNYEVEVALMSGGEPIIGRITKRDKYTITVAGLIIYKHAIETIGIDTGVA